MMRNFDMEDEEIYDFQGLDDLLFYGIHEMGVCHEIKNIE